MKKVLAVGLAFVLTFAVPGSTAVFAEESPELDTVSAAISEMADAADAAVTEQEEEYLVGIPEAASEEGPEDEAKEAQADEAQAGEVQAEEVQAEEVQVEETQAEEALAEEELEEGAEPSVRYRTHVQSIGWQDPVSDGVMSGTQGQARRLEGIEIKVLGGDDLGVRYMTHIQTYGWESAWRYNGTMSGTQGESKRLEAIRIELTGSDAQYFDIWYCVHAQHFGWLDWAKNGEDAGTAGYAYRLEGIKIQVLPKGSPRPIREGTVAAAFYSKNDGPAVDTQMSGVVYNTHVQTYGWQAYVSNGAMAGTYGESKRLEGIHIALANQLYPGNIEYRTHVQTYGWLDWACNGQMAGTSGLSKRLEGIKIKLIPKGFAAPGTTARPNVTAADVPAAAPPQTPSNTPAVTTTYIGNKSSRKFHYADCNSVSNMRPYNKVVLTSREQAINLGYQPCQNCRP